MSQTARTVSQQGSDVKAHMNQGVTYISGCTHNEARCEPSSGMRRITSVPKTCASFYTHIDEQCVGVEGWEVGGG